MADEISNVGLALRTYTRESTVLISAEYLGSTQNITNGYPKTMLEFKRSVPPFLNNIVIMTGRGGPGDVGLAQQEERIDFFCYGSSETQCKKIARALIEYINPQSVRRKTSFTRNNCQVNKLIQEGGPLTLPDPDAADWPYTLVTYMVNYNSVIRV